MKKTLITTAILGMTYGAFAQGVVYFDNLAASAGVTLSPSGNVAAALNDSPLSNPGGAVWYVSLLWSTTQNGTYTAATTFTPDTTIDNNGNGEGFFEYSAGGASKAKLTVGPTGTDFFQVVSWLTTTGASDWATALAGGATYTGASATFSQSVVSATGAPPPPAFELDSGTAWNGNLTLVPVPEPTTMALGGLGAAALMLFRRRK